MKKKIVNQDSNKFINYCIVQKLLKKFNFIPISHSKLIDDNYIT